MSDEPKETTRQRRHSHLPKDLQELVDKDEQFRDSYGDFENSWTTTYVFLIFLFRVCQLILTMTSRRAEDEASNKSTDQSFQEWAQEFLRKGPTEKDSGGS